MARCRRKAASYETLRNGALGSGETFLINVPDNGQWLYVYVSKIDVPTTVFACSS